MDLSAMDFYLVGALVGVVIGAILYAHTLETDPPPPEPTDDERISSIRSALESDIAHSHPHRRAGTAWMGD